MMDAREFDRYGIKHFTPDEVIKTGADLYHVQRKLISHLDLLRDFIGRSILLLPNGLTTGEHVSPYHRLGLAADIAFLDTQGPVFIQTVFKLAIRVGFRGIGIYHNGTAYSFHLDLGEDNRYWAKYKRHGEFSFHTIPLIVDPADYSKNTQ